MVDIVITELGYPFHTTSVVWSDNLATKSMAKNLVFHSRTKYIEIDMHFVHERVEKGEIEVRYIPTTYQIVDIFTKSLARDRFRFLCTKLGLKVSPVQRNIPDTSCSNKLQIIEYSSTEESDLRGSVEA